MSDQNQNHVQNQVPAPGAYGEPAPPASPSTQGGGAPAITVVPLGDGSEPPRKRSTAFWPRFLGSALAVAVGIGVTVWIRSPHNEETAQETVDRVATSTEWTEYRSAQDGFTVELPGSPTVNSDSATVPGAGEVKMTQYLLESSDDVGMAVEIDHLGVEIPAEQVDSALDGALNGGAKGVGGTEGIKDVKIVSSKFGTIEGLRALDGEFSGSFEEKPVTLYVTVFLHKSDLVAVFSVNQSKENFDRMRNSLKFTA